MDVNTNRTIEIFKEIDMIPRKSFNEKAISCYIKEWAEQRKLDVLQDEYYNLLIRKNATRGYENSEPVIIQAHIDMVCEKWPDSTHNFETDPIILKNDGDWIVSAVGTSIGADNGIGVATAMRLLEDDSLEHPPLEIVFTIREEVDFYGAEKFDGNLLKGRTFINLDFAVDDELVAGSCGGFGAYFTIPVSREKKDGYVPYAVSVSGLLGGHSGEDIHRGRGNACVILTRMIKASNYCLAAMYGGTNRLAIPREFDAIVYAPKGDDVAAYFNDALAEIKHEIGKPADGAFVKVVDTQTEYLPLTKESENKVLNSILLYPNGPIELSGNFPGSIESSDNIGIMETFDNKFVITSEARGQHKSSFAYTELKINLLAELVGAETEFFTRYEPWEYAETSRVREAAVKTYKEMFGEDMKVLVVHAGLESSNFVAKYDNLDVIAVGPNCENLHSPSERVSVSSTEKHYQFLTALLKNLK